MKRAGATRLGWGGRGLLAVLLGAGMCCAAAGGAGNSFQELLDRASSNVAAFLDTISAVNCTEHLTQERIAENGKTMEKRESAFDYLVLLSNTGGELNLVESRVAADANKDPIGVPRPPATIRGGLISTIVLTSLSLFTSRTINRAIVSGAI